MLVFQRLDFETEAEGAAREALGARAALRASGVPAGLRAAYGLALLELTAQRDQTAVSAAEVRGQLARVANGGEAAAREVLQGLEQERELARRELAELAKARAAVRLEAQWLAQRAARGHGAGTAEERAEAALELAGANLESTRRLGEEQLEVVFAFSSTRFITVVNAHTLQVLDAGICLGHPPSDKLLTLDSLPAVIQEAIDTEALVILRHP